MALTLSPLISAVSSSTALLAGATGLATYYFVNYGKPKGTPPGPKRVPLVGTTAFSGDKNQLLAEMRKLKEQYGDIYSFYLVESK